MQRLQAVILQNFSHTQWLLHWLLAKAGASFVPVEGEIFASEKLQKARRSDILFGSRWDSCQLFFNTREKSGSGKGKISCLICLDLCGYARGRVTPSFVNSDTVHFFWSQTRKLGPTQTLPYGNCSEMAPSRQFPSSHHRAMEMQQLKAMATTQMLHQRHELWPLKQKKN